MNCNPYARHPSRLLLLDLRTLYLAQGIDFSSHSVRVYSSLRVAAMKVTQLIHRAIADARPLQTIAAGRKMPPLIRATIPRHAWLITLPIRSG
jgi:hypothetical protein